MRDPRGGIFDEISGVHEEMYEASLGSVKGAFNTFQKSYFTDRNLGEGVA